MNREFQKHTISDLIIEFVNGKKYDKSIVEVEIFNRLKYCGFDINTIGYIISYEKAIISKRSINASDGLLKDKYFWINKNINSILFPNPEDYILEIGGLPTTRTLLLGELLCIVDEANILKNHSKNYTDIVMHELEEIGRENFNNWVLYEFFNRLENECRFANGISNNIKTMLFQDSIDKLYDNEMGIVMINRWKSIMPKEAIYIPYE